MSALTIALLGAPRIERDGQPIQVDTRKAIALLAYLAVVGGRHGRDALAALLWPEGDQGHARAALRRTLSSLQAALGPGWLLAERETIALEPGSGLTFDVAEFRHLA